MNPASKSYRSNIILLLLCSQAIGFIDRVNLSVAGPELIKVHGYSPTALGFLFSVFNWSIMLTGLLAGPFVDWVRPRISYPLSVGVWSAATAACSLTTSFGPLAVFRGLVGVGESAMIPSGSRVVRETIEKEKRTFAIAAFFAGNRIGLAVGIPLASTVLYYWGWPWVFYVTGALGVIWIAWWLAVYRAPERTAQEMQSKAESNIRWATLLKYRTTWGIMLGQAGYLYIYYVFATWLPGYLVLERGLSVLNTGFVGMLPFLVGTVCVILGGWAADKLIAAKKPVTLVRKGFAVGGLLAATVFTIAGAYAPGTALAVTFLTLSVASFSFSTAAANSMPLDAAPPHIVSSLVSLQNFGGNFGGSFGPVVTGMLLTATGDFRIPLLVAAGAALLASCSYGLIVGNLDRELQAPKQSELAKVGSN